MATQSLTCQHCGAALQVPDDPRQVHVDCPYCGRQHVAPRELLDALRQQQWMALQERRHQEATSLRRAEHRRDTRLLSVGCFFLVVLPVAAIAVGIWWFVARAARAKDPELNGRATVEATIDALSSQKCATTIVTPETQDGTAGWWAKLHPGQCVHVLAATGIEDNELGMTFRPPAGPRAQTPPPGKSLNFRYCAQAEGKHSIEVIPAANEPWTFALVRCDVPRELKVHRLGEEVANPLFKLTVLRTQPCKPPLHRPNAGSILLGVEVKIEATSPEGLGVSPHQTSIIDSDGRAYIALAWQGAGCDPPLQDMRVAQGEKATGWLNFEVPEKATGLTLVWARFGSHARDPYETRVRLGR